MHKVRFSTFIITISIIMSACQPTAPSQAPQSDGITDIHVNTVVPTENRVTSETFPLPNCGGTGEIHQTLGTTASITKSVTVSGKATVRGGGEADIPETVKLKLEIEIEAAYQKTYESANSRLDTISMPAAAGTHVIYEIGWYEQSFSSLVEYSSNGQVYEVPYTYTLRVPKIDSSQQVACDTNGTTNAIPPTTQPIPQPTIAQVPTQSGNFIHNEPVSPETLARIVGGDAAYWTQAGSVVWVYSNKNHNTTIRHPGENMVLTYWAGFGDPQNASDCQIIISPVNSLEKAVKCPSGTNAQIVADQVGLHLIDYTGFFP